MWAWLWYIMKCRSSTDFVQGSGMEKLIRLQKKKRIIVQGNGSVVKGIQEREMEK